MRTAANMAIAVPGLELAAGRNLCCIGICRSIYRFIYQSIDVPTCLPAYLPTYEQSVYRQCHLCK